MPQSTSDSSGTSSAAASGLPASPAESPYAVAVEKLSPATGHRFSLEPDAALRAQIAAAVGAASLRKLRFEGEISAMGKRDWRLSAKLGATAIQECIVTLDPVTTRIDTPVERIYAAKFDLSAEPGSEMEMPEDVTTEPLPDVIDPLSVLIEALAIALPDYPRSTQADAFEDVAVTEPGKQALSDDDLKPFAGLAALKAQMKDD